MSVRLLSFLCCFLFLLSCHGDDNGLRISCAVDNPVEDLVWLRKATEELANGEQSQYKYVLQGEYNSSTVFIFADCCPFCNTTTFVYDCSGRMIGSVYEGNIDVSILETSTLVWKAENSVCDF